MEIVLFLYNFNFLFCLNSCMLNQTRLAYIQSFAVLCAAGCDSAILIWWMSLEEARDTQWFMNSPWWYTYLHVYSSKCTGSKELLKLFGIHLAACSGKWNYLKWKLFYIALIFFFPSRLHPQLSLATIVVFTWGFIIIQICLPCTEGLAFIMFKTGKDQ